MLFSAFFLKIVHKNEFQLHKIPTNYISISEYKLLLSRLQNAKYLLSRQQDTKLKIQNTLNIFKIRISNYLHSKFPITCSYSYRRAYKDR